MYGLCIFELTYLLYFITVCETSLIWNFKGEQVIYGQDVTLTCNGTSCPLKAIKKWIGGPNYNLLCFDDYSIKPTKYEMKSDPTRSVFDLMIKRFNFDDATSEYTCSCGFFQYTNILKLDISNFIYLPDVDEDSSKQNGNSFQINLSIKGFPLPTCELFYEDIAIPMSLTVIKEPTGNDLVYIGRIRRTVDLKSYQCKGNITLRCQVRSLKRQLLHQHIDLCKSEDEHHEHRAEYVITIIISVFGFIILSITIPFRIYKVVKKKWSHQTEKESMQMLPSSTAVVLNLNSGDSEQFPISHLPLDETEATPISNLPSNGAVVIPMLIAHKDNDNVKYKYSSIAKVTSIKEYDND